MEEDIDTILERRTKLFIHHDRSNHPSSMFSKTFFKAKRNLASGKLQGDDDQLKHGDDIDIDDPEFWKKILGNHIEDEPEDIIQSKRPRRPVDYRQQIHFESDSSFFGDNYTDDALSM